LIGVLLEFDLGKLNGAEGGEVLGIVRDDNEFFDRLVGDGNIPLLPDDRNIVPPAVLHALNVGVGPAEQENLRPQCVPSCQHRKVLLNDGLEQ